MYTQGIKIDDLEGMRYDIEWLICNGWVAYKAKNIQRRKNATAWIRKRLLTTYQRYTDRRMTRRISQGHVEVKASIFSSYVCNRT